MPNSTKKREREVGDPSRQSAKFMKRKSTRKVLTGSAANPLKRQRKGELHSYNPDDRISQLPEEILLVILSFLTIKEAAVTCFLSTRWRYLGASVPRLDFNASFFPVEAHPVYPPWNLRPHYVRRVSKVVRLYKGQNLEEFRLHFGLTEKHKRFIDRCIKFALSKKVRKLELDFDLPFERPNRTYEQKMDSMSYRRDITPNGLDKEKKYAFRGLSSPVCSSFRHFKSLTSLCLRSVRMGGDVLEGLLSDCPLLETLILQHIDDLVCLKVVGPCLRLKHLELSYCPVLEKIELYDVASMASFKLCDNRPTFGSQWSDRNCFMRNLPGLVDVSLTLISKMVDRFGMFNSHLSQLKRLTTNVFLDFLQVDLAVPKLIGLLELEIICPSLLDDNLLNVVSLMEAAPYLEKITIRVLGRKPVAKRKSRDLEKVERRGCSDGLQHLKVMELAGYRRHSNEDGFISYVIENARALETIIIDPDCQNKSKWDFFARLSSSEVEKISRYVRQHSRQWLKGIIPPTIQLLIR